MKAVIHFPGKARRIATLVDVIPLGAELSDRQHELYYNKAQYTSKKAVNHTRLIFRYDENGRYCVMPDIMMNRGYWTIVREKEKA